MTNIEGREAHFNGEHNVADATPAERVRWAEQCAYCARIARIEGTPLTTHTAAAPRVPQGGSYRNGGGVVKPASEKQVALIKRLLAEKDLTNSSYDGWVPDNYTGTSGGRKASEMIDYLFTLPRKQAPRPTPAPQVTEDGMYQDPEGVIYKVQIAKQGSGNLYAKVLVIEEGQGAHFEYAAGAIRTIRPEWKMTLEQAAKFGQLYGCCCVCGRDLTDEGSIAAGIGPICAKGF